MIWWTIFGKDSAAVVVQCLSAGLMCPRVVFLWCQPLKHWAHCSRIAAIYCLLKALLVIYQEFISKTWAGWSLNTSFRADSAGHLWILLHFVTFFSCERGTLQGFLMWSQHHAMKLCHWTCVSSWKCGTSTASSSIYSRKHPYPVKAITASPTTIRYGQRLQVEL